LRYEALSDHPLSFSSTPPDDPAALTDFFLTRLKPESESVILGAFDGSGSLVGTAGLRREPGAKERHKALIGGLYVTHGSRRQGVGRALMRAAIERAGCWPGVHQIHLSVTDASAEARRLYEDEGFVEWGREPSALHWEGRYVDESHLVLDLRRP
jgi:GNAT superfamily N-acetyltransferase